MDNLKKKKKIEKRVLTNGGRDGNLTKLSAAVSTAKTGTKKEFEKIQKSA